MCFSETASFTVGSLILAFSIFGPISNYFSSHWPNRHYWWAFLFIPVLFGIQQICEGFIWRELENKDESSSPAMYVFTIIAYVVWPTYIPFCSIILNTQQINNNTNYATVTVPYLWDYCLFRIFQGNINLINTIRKYLLYIFLLLGICASLSLGLIIYPQIHAQVSFKHIFYHWDFPTNINASSLGDFLSFCYIVSTIFPPFTIGGIAYLYIIAILMMCSVIISYTLFVTTFSSSWCFFAAVISLTVDIMLLLNINYSNKQKNQDDNSEKNEEISLSDPNKAPLEEISAE